MKFIKFLSLIAIITCAPALYAMEPKALQVFVKMGTKRKQDFEQAQDYK